MAVLCIILFALFIFAGGAFWVSHEQTVAVKKELKDLQEQLENEIKKEDAKDSIHSGDAVADFNASLELLHNNKG